MSGEKKRVLAFDLFSGIWPQSQLLTKTLAQLDPEKFEVTYVSCGTLLASYCTVMESRKRPLGRGLSAADCMDCKFSAGLNNRLLSRLRVSTGKTIFLSQYSQHEDDAIVHDLSRLVVEQGYPIDFDYQGIPLVRLALYDTMLRYKKLKTDINPQESEYFMGNFKNCVRVLLAGARFLESRQDQFDLAVCPNPEYGPNNTFSKVALNLGVSTYAFVSSWNIDEMYSSAMLWKWEHLPRTSVALRTWKGTQNLSPSSTEMARAEAHHKQLLIGKSPFVYSQPYRSGQSAETTRELLRIPQGRKVLLMSLSSTDEVLASQAIGLGHSSNYPGTVFRDQFEWVERTILWAESRGDVTLVVRLHPRDLPNKRDSVQSEQYTRWISLLEEHPETVAINHPSQQLSFRQVCEVADLVATGWSSTAIEAMLLGKGVVTYDSDLPGFPSDIHITGNTSEEYLSNLETYLDDIHFSDNQSLAKSWLVHKAVMGSVKLSGRAWEKARNSGPKVVRLFFSALERYLFFAWRPLELFLTFRVSEEKNRINILFLEQKTDLYS